eukprot:maker-scaffold_54-snap-gene-0.46-mRNA-1 protein AED:0.32 eAED:0.32 QI:70/1/1/1/1/1/2/63/305
MSLSDTIVICPKLFWESVDSCTLNNLNMPTKYERLFLQGEYIKCSQECDTFLSTAGQFWLSYDASKTPIFNPNLTVTELPLSLQICQIQLQTIYELFSAGMKSESQCLDLVKGVQRYLSSNEAPFEVCLSFYQLSAVLGNVLQPAVLKKEIFAVLKKIAEEFFEETGSSGADHRLRYKSMYESLSIFYIWVLIKQNKNEEGEQFLLAHKSYSLLSKKLNEILYSRLKRAKSAEFVEPLVEPEEKNETKKSVQKVRNEPEIVIKAKDLTFLVGFMTILISLWLKRNKIRRALLVSFYRASKLIFKE